MSLSNPLLQASTLDHGAIRFDLIRDEHFLPAFEDALKEARANLDQIRIAKDPATFENTLEALETCSEKLEHISDVFGNLLSAHTNDKLQELAKEIMPRLAEFSNDVYLDPALFARVKEINERSKEFKLDAERAKLLEKTYKAFVRNGALLNEEKKSEIREIDKKLALDGQQYSDHVLKATNAYELLLSDRAELAGLPESVVEAAALTAKERSKEGKWVFTLDMPSFIPFMRYSDRSELREKMWRASGSRGLAGDTDNRELVKEIVRLRHRRAQIMGFPTHSHFVLEERMASDPLTVQKFLSRLLEVSRPAAEKDLKELQELSGLGKNLKPWDFAYWSEKLKSKRYSFDEEQLRPYFKIENVMAGIFEHARRLYGLTFKPRTDLPAYHVDVQVYEACDERSGDFVGLFYVDSYPRASKRGGAWMTQFQSQGLLGGKVVRPHVAIVCNHTKPTETKPSLLSLNEVRTTFHEFGHALHGLLSQCRYRALSGPNVYWDFVELPSQIMEGWMTEKEGLDLFAKHYKTGETIPADLVDKIKKSTQFQAGYQSLRQINLGMLDMAWHGQDPGTVEDVEKFETQATQVTSLFPHFPGVAMSTSFSHIFAGGYSAGYYSYKWAEVLAADAFELFLEKGLFDRETARKFKEHVLSKGGSEHPMTLYKRFRGREPDPDALLRKDGLK